MASQTGRIVVGYDGSRAAGAAVDWAAAEAQRRRSPLTVLHVLDAPPGPVGPVGPVGAPGPAGVTASPGLGLSQDVIDRVATGGAARARRNAGGLDIVPLTERGHPAGTLIEAAHDADLIVVGTRGHGNVGSVMLGSVSLAVSAHARCPTIVVRGDASLLPGPYRPVVVGVDDSPAADAVLRFAADTAAATAARLVVVSGYVVAESRCIAESVCAAAARTARTIHPGLEVTERVAQGPVAGVITAATYQAGLVVVGSRGRGGFSGLLLGSVSHRLLHTALCPVAVVRGIL